MADKIVAIVPAGGIGQRANAGTGMTIPKQYRPILGRSMLRRSVQALLADARIAEVLIGIQAHDDWAVATIEDLERVSLSPVAGPTRAETVLGVLDAALLEGKLAPQDWVLVHDAARPGLPKQDLKSLIDACVHHQQGGLLARQATDTVKFAGLSDGINGPVCSETTLPREQVWFAQTPQMFRAQPLSEALHAGLKNGEALTDEASAMELMGERPLLIAGSARNFKVTWPEDFERMEAVIELEYSDRTGV
ncbi:2-C-methyl-D-erythritol 4-phosphate cytidylyltransferase [Orrella sp. 11846]|uniref:IspD/TarI family cytidylyltransferase n=1 Tax=Orrella sp. 11846 TaxID=3409913 RepID=UPI003B5C43FA